jgi:hypothetical protein
VRPVIDVVCNEAWQRPPFYSHPPLPPAMGLCIGDSQPAVPVTFFWASIPGSRASLWHSFEEFDPCIWSSLASHKI